MAWKRFRNRVFVACLSGAVASTAATTFAQSWGWGSNAYPPVAPCVPAQPWGYYQTQWHQWPGAIYPGMEKRGGSAGNEIPPSSTVLPEKNSEADIQSVLPPKQESSRSNEPRSMEDRTPDSTNPLIPDRSRVPKGDELEPLQVPGFGIPDQTPGLPSGTDSGVTPSPRAGSLLKQRARSGNPSTLAGYTDSNPVRMQTTQRDNGRLSEPATTRIRAGNSGFVKPTTPDREPDLFLPSLSARPLQTSSLDARSARPTAGNPLRSTANDIARGSTTGTSVSSDSAVPASFNDADTSDIFEAPPVAATPTPSTMRANPLRRN
ncbi:MAG TPA: hypothetical protein VGJ15_07505 [Pirellulales bacterium]